MTIITRLYNNIYASAYLAYAKGESNPKGRASSFVYMHFFLTFMVLFFSLKIIYPPPFEPLIGNRNFKFALIGVGIAILFLIRYYYNESRVEDILNHFKHLELKKRKTWGYFTVISFIIEVVLVMILPFFFNK
jgi:magnesium-transporting ATPase (P-type)